MKSSLIEKLFLFLVAAVHIYDISHSAGLNSSGFSVLPRPYRLCLAGHIYMIMVGGM